MLVVYRNTILQPVKTITMTFSQNPFTCWLQRIVHNFYPLIKRKMQHAIADKVKVFCLALTLMQ